MGLLQTLFNSGDTAMPLGDWNPWVQAERMHKDSYIRGSDVRPAVQAAAFCGYAVGVMALVVAFCTFVNSIVFWLS